MSAVLDEFLQAHRVSVFIALMVPLAVAVWALLKSRFAAKTAGWPTVWAKIENVFVDVSNSLDRLPNTRAVLAYSYFVNGSCHSGQIRLVAGESSLEILKQELVGPQISVRRDPSRPEVSIFQGDEIQGWDVEKDPRLSVWTSVGRLLDRLP
jgi:hypothetical protein